MESVLSDLDEVLDGANASEPAESEAKAEEAPATDVTEPEPPKEDPEAKEATPEAEAKPQPEEPKEQSVPLATFLDMRDKAKRADQLQQELQRMQQAQQREAPQVPDMFEDPEAYRKFQDQNMQAALRQQEIGISERFARSSVGEDEFAKVQAFIEANAHNPAVHAAGFAQDPWGEAVKLYKQHATLSEVGDPESFRAKVREEILAEMKAKEADQQSQRQEVIPSDFTKGQGGGSQRTTFVKSDLSALVD